MKKRVKVRKMGGSVGVTLPKEMVDRLHIEESDELTVVETSRGLLLTPYDPEFEEEMEAYERGARTYRDALRELADS